MSASNFVATPCLLQAAHAELMKVRPNDMDDTMRGCLLMRGARLTDNQRESVLMKTNCDYSWKTFVPLFKRMCEDKEAGCATVRAFLGGSIRVFSVVRA